MHKMICTWATLYLRSLSRSVHERPAIWLARRYGVPHRYLSPSFLLVIGVSPFWEQLRHSSRTQAALAEVNAGVVGLLLAALYSPVWTSAILEPQDFELALIALVALMFWRAPPWLVVLGCGLLGWLLNHVL